MFTRSLFSLLMIAFLAVGCASKPKNQQDAGGATGADGSNAGLTLELNGSSDNNTAGGLETIYFAFDSAQLDGESRRKLEQNAEFLKNNQNVDAQIEGHADERGSRQYNLALGERRAKAVKDMLVALGVSGNRISTVSYGSERPVAEGSSEEAWSRNRRANFVITAK